MFWLYANTIDDRKYILYETDCGDVQEEENTFVYGV